MAKQINTGIKLETPKKKRYLIRRILLLEGLK